MKFWFRTRKISREKCLATNFGPFRATFPKERGHAKSHQTFITVKSPRDCPKKIPAEVLLTLFWRSASESSYFLQTWLGHHKQLPQWEHFFRSGKLTRSSLKGFLNRRWNRNPSRDAIFSGWKRCFEMQIFGLNFHITWRPQPLKTSVSGITWCGVVQLSERLGAGQDFSHQVTDSSGPFKHCPLCL